MEKRKYKVTKNLSGIPKVFRKWEEWAIGDIVVGKIIGTHTDQYDKLNLIVEVEEAFFSKDSAKFKDKNLVLNHCGKMAAAVFKKNKETGEETLKIPEGTLVQISYDGTSMIEKGKFKGKDAHVVSVDIVEEDTGDLEDEIEL